MSVLFGAASAVFKPQPVPIFVSPEAAGRRIVCGFSYVQRIGKGAHTEVWFPASLQEKVAARVLAGDASVLDEFHVEWAAVRQFELMQEADNYYIFDLKVEHFSRAYEDVLKMRAKGYRITVITMGNYVEPTHYDELRILDVRLQDEITRLIHMLYLEEQSVAESKIRTGELCAGMWDFTQALPHVAMTLGAADLFAREFGRCEDVNDSDDESNDLRGKKKKGDTGDQSGIKAARKLHQHKLSRQFFRILELLPQRHIAHDVAVGLALPEASKKKNWVYCAPGEYTYHAFQTALATVFRASDHISLSALHERANAKPEIMPVMHHMRGYGDRGPDQESQNRAMAAYLQQARKASLN